MATIILVDRNGNPLGSTVAVSPVSHGLDVFAVDSDLKAPLSVFWTLQNSGLVNITPTPSIGTTKTSLRGPSFFGALVGFTSNSFVQTMTVGPSTMTTYVPPPVNLYKATCNALLIASTGPQTVALQIRVDNVSMGEWS